MALFTPRLAATAPHGWLVKESIEMVGPDKRIHVTASSEPLPPDTTTARYADAYGALLKTQFPEFRESGVAEAAWSGRPAIMRRFEWQPPNAEKLTQVQVYCVDGAMGYVATATTRSDAFGALEKDVMSALAGLAFVGDAPPARPAATDGTEAFVEGDLPVSPATDATQASWADARDAWNASVGQ